MVGLCLDDIDELEGKSAIVRVGMIDFDEAHGAGGPSFFGGDGGAHLKIDEHDLRVVPPVGDILEDDGREVFVPELLQVGKRCRKISFLGS